MMRTNLSCRFGLAGCLALAAGWGILALSGTALADKADADGNHHHGGGGGEEDAVLFDVTTPDPDSAMQIIGFFDPDGTSITPTGCRVELGPAAGRADKSQVIVNRPSPAIQMDFLAVLECFTAEDIYALDCGGDLVIIQARNGSARIEYYFLAEGKNGQEQGYRIDGDAIIMADDDPDGTCGDGSFPKGACGYTVYIDNIRVSQDTGPRRNACEGSFPNPAVAAVIRLDRIP